MDLKKRLLTMKSGHEVQFTELVLCTHYPIEALRGLQIMKLSVDRSYIVSAEGDMRTSRSIYCRRFTKTINPNSTN